MDKGKGKQEDAVRATGAETMPWVEKYRPSTLDDVVSHKDILSTLDKFITANKLPHLLFYGPPGTGKTSTVLAMARQIYKTPQAIRNNVLELNASDDRGIDVVREQIKNFASTKMVFSGYEMAKTLCRSYSSGFKLIILDEADQMTQAAQSALRRVIEQYTRNVRFCIICNYVNRIIPAIQSRCTRFRFGPLDVLEVERRMLHVADCEGVVMTEDGKEALKKLCKGDMRRVLNVMQACHSGYGKVDETAVYECTGNPHPKDIEEIVTSMMNEEFQTAFKRITDLKAQNGLALQDIITGIYEFLQTVEMPKVGKICILDHLATVEHRLSTGGSEKLQLSSLLGSFKVGVELGALHPAV